MLSASVAITRWEVNYPSFAFVQSIGTAALTSMLDIDEREFA